MSTFLIFVCVCLCVLEGFLTKPAYSLVPPRWWGVSARKDSAGSPARTLQTYVEANPASEECSASQSQSRANSPVESVLIIPSLREKRDTSASSMVCSMQRFLYFINLFLQTRLTVNTLHSRFLVYRLRHVQPSFPLPLPQRCAVSKHETKLHLHV